MAGARSSASVEATFDSLPRRRYTRSTVMYREGEPPDTVSFIHHGLVKLVTTGVDGSSALVGFRGANEWLGEHSALDGHTRLTTAMVAVEATVTTVDREVFTAMVLDDPTMQLQLLQSCVGHLRASTRHVLELASGDPTALVARRLLELLSESRFASLRTVDGDTVSIEMPVSHDELASWAGVSRRSVESALKKLRSAGSISTGRMRVVVLDPETLERCSQRRPIDAEHFAGDIGLM